MNTAQDWSSDKLDGVTATRMKMYQ